MQKKISSLKFLILIGLACLCLSMSFATLAVQASEVVFVTENYWHFDNPENIFISDTAISVSDTSLEVFSLKGEHSHSIELPASSTNAVSYNGKLIYTTDESVCIDEFVSDKIYPTDYDISSDNLVAYSDRTLYFFDINTTTYSIIDTTDNIIAITAIDDIVYYVCNSNGSYMLKMCENNAISVVLPLSGAVTALTCTNDNTLFYAIDNVCYFYNTVQDIVSYYVPVSTSIIDADGENGSVYYLQSDGSVCLIDDNFNHTILLQSASTELGFYDNPTSIATRNGSAYVVDYNNNRVVELQNDIAISSISTYMPNDVCVDYFGNVYIASSLSVKKYNSEHIFEQSILLPDNSAEVMSIAIDYSSPLDGDVYALAADGLLANITSEVPTSVHTNYNELCFSFNGDLYAMTETSIVMLDKTTLTVDNSFTSIDIASGASDFAVDNVGNIFISYTDHIHMLDAENSYDQSTSNTISGDISSICISLINTNSVSYGDILVTNSTCNAIVNVSELSATMQLSPLDDYFEQFTNTDPNLKADQSIIFNIQQDNVSIYSSPSEMPATYTLNTDDTVVLVDDITFDDDGYWCILVDSSYGSCTYGFVNKCFMTSPTVYTEQTTASYATILHSSTLIKKYPSSGSTTIATASTVGENYLILDFVSSYIDIYGDEWCRILYNSSFDGYILKNSVSIDGNIVIGNSQSLPHTNATVIAVVDEEYILTYLDDAGTELLAITIEVGASVSVVGTFNVSSDFTQIQYAYYNDNSTLCLLTCYVDTNNLSYEEVTLYQLLAFVGIILIISIGVVLLVIKLRKSSSLIA